VIVNLQAAAKTLGGKVYGKEIRCPGPGHSKNDESLSVTFDSSAPEGFVVKSFSPRDDWRTCRDYVKARLGLRWEPRRRSSAQPIRPTIEKVEDDDRQRIEWAARAWRQSVEPWGSLVETYLRTRGVTLLADCDAIRFHPRAAFRLASGELVHLPAMVGLMSHAVTGEPRAVHRTALKPDGSGKADLEGLGNAKKMLGPCRGCVVRLSPDDQVLDGLGLTEGIEDGLSIIGSGWKPVWACGSAGAIADFAILCGVEHLTIFADRDQAGQKAAVACVKRWCEAGRSVDVYTPPAGSKDFNDLARRLIDGR
jgi:hypothetical protein